MSQKTYYVTIIPKVNRWEWIIYDSPQRRGMDREAGGVTVTRWGARREARRWVKHKGRNREQRYEIQGKAEG